MAKRKRKSSKQPPKSSVPSRPQSELPPDLPDRRAIEGVIKGVLGGLVGGPVTGTPLYQAQELMSQAFRTRDPEVRVKLARQALELWPDCADAYVLLAEHARNRNEALHLFEQGVAAGTRAIGSQAFQEDVGHFWSMLETRPYMRAREGLASKLWSMGRRDESIEHLQDMLRLNPGDNQGLRYTLAGWLLAEGREEELTHLLKQYDEQSTAWAYTKALVAYRKHGDTPETRKLLAVARKENKHVPDYLLGRKFLPREQPSYYSPGDEAEAVCYVGTDLSVWKETPGAIPWIEAIVSRPRTKTASKTKAQGPTSLVKKRLENLPQSADVWQADCRRLPSWVEGNSGRCQPWIIMVTNRTDDVIVTQNITEEPPSSGLIWDTLVGAMERPDTGEPHRPGELQVPKDERWEDLPPHLEHVGIRCVWTAELDHLDLVFTSLCRHLTKDERPGLLEMPGVTPAQVDGVFQAAAGFFQRAPWRKLGDETAIKVECNRFESGPWYAVVMGQSGLTFGLSLFEDLNALKTMWSSQDPDRENTREAVTLTVVFGDETEISLLDLEAARKHGWNVAGPLAYPWIFRKELGMTIRPPLAWELELIEGSLRAIPAFIARQKPDDLSKHKMSVPVVSGSLALTLSWIEE